MTESQRAGYGVGKTGSPAFAIRGIIEGFYGRPWSHEQRLDMIGFIADRGMNTFVYAPKDDPFVRRDWREAYPSDELADLAELVEACRTRSLDFVYCLSPGLSIRYSSAEDRTSLASKFESLAALGVSFFGLLLDDIPGRLQHDEDQAGFDDLAAAHCDLIDWLFLRLAGTNPARRLVVCPTQYFGRGNEEYITRLGAIDRRIDIFWTGRLICSPHLDLSDAQVFANATGRQPLYWDNYPVNDVAMTHELHIGPYRGRDPELHLGARGVIANAMEYVEASKIPIATIADYLWSPGTYDPEESLTVALRDVVGAAGFEAFARFADNVRSSCLSLDDALVFTDALERFEFLREVDRPADAARVLAETAKLFSAAAAELLGGRTANPALVRECRPWIESFAIGAEAIERIATLLAEGRLERDAPLELRPYRDALLAARKRVFGDALEMTLSELVDPITPRTTRKVPSHKEAAS
jgi:hyaluronoglucosaminidase